MRDYDAQKLNYSSNKLKFNIERARANGATNKEIREALTEGLGETLFELLESLKD